MKVLICCPNWRHLGLECHRGLLQVAAAATPTPEGWGIGSILWGKVPYEIDFLYSVHTNMPFAREFLVDAAMERCSDYSVHVDADTGFELEHVFGLLELLTPPDVVIAGECEDPIVAAASPIALRHPPHNVAAFPGPFTETRPASWWNERREVVDVAATGMGLIAFVLNAAREIQRPLFPIFDNRFGDKACPVDDLPLWLRSPHAKMVGSDVGFTSRLTNVGRVVIDNREGKNPVRHIVETSVAPFERTEGGPGAGKCTL